MELLNADLTGRLPCTFTIDGFGINGRPPLCAEPAVWWEEHEGQPVLWCKGHYREISGDIAALVDPPPPSGPPPGG